MSISANQLKELKTFVQALKANSDLLYTSELAFFKEYLLSMGANLPPKKPENKHSAKVEEDEDVEEVFTKSNENVKTSPKKEEKKRRKKI